jgi:hypothetical protein
MGRNAPQLCALIWRPNNNIFEEPLECPLIPHIENSEMIDHRRYELKEKPDELSMHYGDSVYLTPSNPSPAR